MKIEKENYYFLKKLSHSTNQEEKILISMTIILSFLWKTLSPKTLIIGRICTSIAFKEPLLFIFIIYLAMKSVNSMYKEKENNSLLNLVKILNKLTLKWR